MYGKYLAKGKIVIVFDVMIIFSHNPFSKNETLMKQVFNAGTYVVEQSMSHWVAGPGAIWFYDIYTTYSLKNLWKKCSVIYGMSFPAW